MTQRESLKVRQGDERVGVNAVNSVRLQMNFSQVPAVLERPAPQRADIVLVQSDDLELAATCDDFNRLNPSGREIEKSEVQESLQNRLRNEPESATSRRRKEHPQDVVVSVSLLMSTRNRECIPSV